MEPTDASLLEAWRAGDRRAGDDLFRRHFDALYRFFDRKVQGEAADLVQRTFLGLLEAGDRFRGDASVRTYLFAIARHELLAHWRSRRKEGAFDSATESLHDLDPTPSLRAAKAQEDRVLLAALRRIPLDLQIAIELHYWEGLRGPELARVLDVPEGTVRSRLRRGLELLRAAVEHAADSPAAVQTSLAGLDQWAARLRDEALGSEAD